MSFYLGPFYFEEKDIFILAATGLLGYGWVNNIPLPFISYPNLIVLMVLFLIARTFLLRTYESLIFIVFLSSLILLNFFPLSIVILYILFSFIFLRLFKII